MLQPLGEAAIHALAPQAGRRALDVGCGAGATSRALAAKVGPTGHVTGVDTSAPMLAVAQARGGGPDSVLADAGGAAIPGMPFDAAFSRFGVMFFEDPRASFAHLRSALKPGVPVVFVCWRSTPRFAPGDTERSRRYRDSHRRSSESRPGRNAYPSDFTNAEWDVVEPLWLTHTSDLPVEHELRDVLDALRYIGATGTPWRYLPHDFPPHATVRRWTGERSRSWKVTSTLLSPAG